MHRSGTSLLAGVLRILGLNFGENLMGSAPSNELGHFEHNDIVRVDDKILKQLNSSWDDINDLPDLWFKRDDILPHKHEIKEIITRDFSNINVFGIKDPRIAILLPLYLDIFAELNIEPLFVVIKRYALEVSKSLEKRDNFKLLKSLNLIIKCEKSIEKFTDNRKKVYISFNDLINYPKFCIEKIKDNLRVELKSYDTFESDLVKFIDPRLKHHSLSQDELSNNLVLALNDISRKLEDGEKATNLLKNLVANAEKEIREKDVKIHNILTSLKEKDAERANAEKEIRRLSDVVAVRENYINGIERSLTFKILGAYQKFINFILPEDSKLRKIYDLLIKKNQQFWNNDSKKNVLENRSENLRVAVFVHLYYEDLWKEFSEHIKNIPLKKYDVFVNLVEDSYSQETISYIKNDFPNVNITISPNLGYDIGGFINQIKNIDFSKYDLICKIHSKKSLHHKTFNGEIWRARLLNSILGSKERVKSVFQIFETSPKVGMVGSAEFLRREINSNYDFFVSLCKKFSLPVDVSRLEFFAGTMFWCRADIIQIIKQADMKIEDFKRPDAEKDGTLAHAFERFFGYLTKEYGYQLQGIKSEIKFLAPKGDVSKIRAISFYFPQYHRIHENDKWWGDGFTDWVNVKKAKPLFSGHYQPHEPTDFLGYYNLDSNETMLKQADMAREYGIFGFCYYYYWFNGKKVLDAPINKMLKNEKIDFPFCICWANENWTRKWDGLENNILMEQKHSLEQDIEFIKDVMPFLKDKRYIKIDNKPLLLVYRPSLFKNAPETVSAWREECKKEGFPDVYLCMVQSFGEKSPLPYGFDAAVQFPPHNMGGGVKIENNSTYDIPADFTGALFDYQKYVNVRDYLNKENYKLFRGIMPQWDNTARRVKNQSIFVNATPDAYSQWLLGIVNYTKNNFWGEEKIIFINAWNEWAEGCHLEPDKKYGNKYLEITKKILG